VHDRILVPTTIDAVVVIPGIMGSVLRDVRTNELLWGFDKPSLYIDAWLSGNFFAKLAVTEAERGGDTTRVKPDGVLRMPAWAPFLQGFEPYVSLVDRLRPAVRDPAAIIGFGYDWRLSIAHNARELERVALDHLERWRAHPQGSKQARLVLVAHSMGGLVSRYFTHVLGHADSVGATVTLGTPYYGSVKSLMTIGLGLGAPVPLPKKRVRKMARTMPGMYDLLPFYRCVDEGESFRRLEPTDVAGIGGDAELAREANHRHDELMRGDAGALRLVVGTKQPTLQSVTFDSGAISAHEYECSVDASGAMTRVDRLGDGTVYRGAAAAFGLTAAAYSQSHGAMPRMAEIADHALDILTHDTAGPPLGAAVELGMIVDDSVTTGMPLHVGFTGAEPTQFSVRVDAVLDDHRVQQVATPPTRYIENDKVVTDVVLTYPGLYRISAQAGSASAVTQLVMAVPPAALDRDPSDEDD
jgi:hypothetical protein